MTARAAGDAGRLHRLQAQFLDYLLKPGGQMRDQVVGTPKANADVRLDIYAKSYRLRLLEVLQNDFPAVASLLGEAGFERMGRAYIDAHPSQHFSLRWFGRHLSRFLADSPPYCERPQYAEMAAFEWALGEAFDAADGAFVVAADLTGLPHPSWPRMRLRMHPSVRRLDLFYNVPVRWQAINEKRETPAPEAREQPLGWVIWRRQLKNFFRSLSADEAWALDALSARKTFAEICEGLCEWHADDQAALRAAGLLKGWVDEGMIAGIHTA